MADPTDEDLSGIDAEGSLSEVAHLLSRMAASGWNLTLGALV